jgi:alpha-galactosidase
MKSRFNKSLLMGVTVLVVLISNAAGQVWELKADFSTEKNPNGPWTFGWQQKPGSRLNPYDLLWGTQGGVAIKGFWAPGWFGPIRAWCAKRNDTNEILAQLPPPGQYPYPDHWVEANFAGDMIRRQATGQPSYADPSGFVGLNTSPGAFGGWGYFWEPNMVLLMPPGGHGQKAKTVARWTSPVTGKVVVTAEFTGQRIQGDSGIRADVHVYLNAAPQFDGFIDGFVGRSDLNDDDFMGKKPAEEWSSILSVHQGDVIDFTAGTGTNYNFNQIGLQSKQVLPGVGLAATISVLPDEHEVAKHWVDAKFEAMVETNEASPAIADFGSRSSTPPFSFNFDGKPFLDLVKSWQVAHHSRQIDVQRMEHTVEFTDPQSGLGVRCVGVEYLDFPTIEWTIYFKNNGMTDTPIIENIQALDLPVRRGSGAEFIVNRVLDNRLMATKLPPNFSSRLVDPFPYFNMELPGGGVIMAISWSGLPAIQFTRDNTNGLRIQAGQDLTHFKLHPGEEVRTPMIVLQFWSGDRVQAQNVWRRWMIAHNMPKPEGRDLGPQRAASAAYQYGNMVNATEENQELFIHRYVEEGLRPDFWWMDAGWYPPNISKNGTQLWALTGTWEADRSRFPHGLRAVTDYAHARGIKSILWCQPERASPGTWLHENHPEFFLGADGADKLLDFGNHEAWQWTADHFSQLMVDEGIDIYRQDMNIGPVGYWRGNDAPDRQGITEIHHVMGYLAYLDELLRRNPHLRLDHFRIDLETLRRAAPLILGIDFEPTGDQCHNYRIASWIPWHGLCIREINPYAFRSMMCPAIVTGWDLRRKDLNYPLARQLVHQWEAVAPDYLGDFYPLTPYSIQNDSWMAWQFDRPEAGCGIVQVFRRTDSTEERAIYKLRGLDEQALYVMTDLDTHISQKIMGSYLMKKGLSIRLSKPNESALITYKKCAPGS